MSRYSDTEHPPPPPVNPHAELLASLERINTFNPPVQTCSTGWKCSGLYTGPTSVAYLFYRLSQIYPALTFKGQGLADWASSYLELGRSYLPAGNRASVDANHCGVGNETLCQIAIRACMDQDASVAKQLCAYSQLIVDSSTGANEWLYGRAGYLYLLRLVRAAFRQSNSTSVCTLLERTINMTVNRILSTPRPWQWHGQVYFGAVHGYVGIITQLLLSTPDPKQFIPTLESILPDLLSRQFPSGNFPSSLESESDRLVQFCHGSPGFLICLRSISKYLPSLRHDIETSIARAQRDLLARGLLTKAPCLCHGIPTNALALKLDVEFEEYMRYMSTERLESNEQWMRKAGQSDDFVGLYTGEAGRAWAWAVLDQVKQGCDRWQMGIIGFNDV